MLKPLNTTLAGLPREVRDTLFLLAVIGWVVLMQAAHIPPWHLAGPQTMKHVARLIGWRH